jgi:hypothetical protein
MSLFLKMLAALRCAKAGLDEKYDKNDKNENVRI